MDKLGMYAVPAVILVIVAFGGIRRVRVFDCFTEGAKEGFSALLSVAPSLIGLIVGVTMLEASGFFFFFLSFVPHLTNRVLERNGHTPIFWFRCS